MLKEIYLDDIMKEVWEEVTQDEWNEADQWEREDLMQEAMERLERKMLAQEEQEAEQKRLAKEAKAEVLLEQIPEELEAKLSMQGNSKLTWMAYNHPDEVEEMLKDGSLEEYLLDWQSECGSQRKNMERELMQKRHIDESLKATDPLKYEQEMNLIHSQVQEILDATMYA